MPRGKWNGRPPILPIHPSFRKTRNYIMALFQSPSSPSLDNNNDISSMDFLSSPGNSGKSIKVQTWNVWFDQFQRKNRFDAILEETLRNLPDVACFQEVTMEFIQKVNSNQVLSELYYSSDRNGNTIQRYGVLTLAKKELQPKFVFHTFPTEMGRKLLLTELNDFGENRVCVGNVHLESLSNETLRAKQLKVCCTVFKNYQSYILCGDFNFCSYRNYFGGSPLENDNFSSILPNAVDIWSALHPLEAGYTFDGNINCLVSDSKEQMRYDRIVAFLNNPGWIEQSTIRIIGNVPIRESGVSSATISSSANDFSTPPRALSRVLRDIYGKSIVDVYPSDHFGLLAELSID